MIIDLKCNLSEYILPLKDHINDLVVLKEENLLKVINRCTKVDYNSDFRKIIDK